MEAADLDEGGAGGKERLGHLRQEQLAAPGPSDFSLSSRRAGESKQFGAPNSPSTSAGMQLVQQTTLEMTKDFYEEVKNPVVVSLGPKTTSSNGYKAGKQSPRTPVKGVVQGVDSSSESRKEGVWQGFQMDVSTPIKSPGMGGSNLKETEEADLMYVPDDDQDWMRPKRPPSAESPGPSAVMKSPILPMQNVNSPVDETSKEEEEWLARKRLSGVIGRMVQYGKGDLPSKDVLGLARTSNGRIMVTCVRHDGPAARAGVVSGDQLASINGEPIWEYTPAKAVLSGVQGPATLVFLGFSGKLQAEVRIKQPDEPRLGLPERVSVPTKVLAKTKRDEVRKNRLEVQVESPASSPSLSVTDTVVFNPNLVAKPAEEVVFSKRTTQSLLIATEDREVQQASADSGSSGVYELLREDARDLLLGALNFQALKSEERAAPVTIDTYV
mmetsp:Transcript_8907/g.15727  ORF Transcript_8907/g.15727 Transcript_8907/m.15727 type:complete len:441 (-) Transcript_8907:40-1362(-)